MTDFICPYVEVICYEKGLCFLHEICSCDESVFAQRFPVLFLERQKTKHYFWKMHDNLNFSLMIVWRGIYCFNNCYFWLSDMYGFYLLWLQCNLSYIWMFLAIYGSSVAVFSHITYIKIVWGCNLNMYELSDLFEIDIFLPSEVILSHIFKSNSNYNCKTKKWSLMLCFRYFWSLY